VGDELRAAGLEHFTWHCLRQTFASRLVMAGVDIRTVQELLGHKTTPGRVRCSHLAPKHTLAAVERLDVSSGEPTDTTTDAGDIHPIPSEGPVLQELIH
jgi:integrase